MRFVRDRHASTANQIRIPIQIGKQTIFLYNRPAHLIYRCLFRVLFILDAGNLRILDWAVDRFLVVANRNLRTG